MSPLFRSALSAVLLVASASAATAFPQGTIDRPFTTPLAGLDEFAPGQPTESVVLGLGFQIVAIEVGVAGDVDANGASDWLTGTPLYAPVGPLSAIGRVVVTRRNQNGTVLATKTYNGSGESAYFGASVASLGDINADGYDDFAIGSPGYNAGTGRVYIYKGSATGTGNSPATLDGTPGSFFGYKVAYAGDVNGDGYDDLLASAPGTNDGLNGQGAAYCYLGGPNGIVSTPVRTWLGDSAFDYLGYGIAGGGDVNADSYADVLIGAPGYGNGEVDEGRATLYLGGPGGPAAFSAWSYESETIGELLGQVLTLPGDVNSDGYGDIAIGLPNADYGGTDNGRIMVFGGGPFLFSLPLIYDRGGDSNGEALGYDIAPAGDQNGDGFADVLAGAPFGGGLGLDGRWWILYGSPILNEFDTSLFFEGIAGARAGLSVSGGGDQGDGVPDVLAGYFVPFPKGAAAPAIAAPAGTEPGPGVLTVRGFTIHEVGYFFTRQFAQGINETGFGSSSVIMDINGDGYDDAIVGGYIYSGSIEEQGIVRAYFGDDDGFGDSEFPFAKDGRPEAAGGGPVPPSWNLADWSFEGPLEFAHFGYSMANAGDVNGDGFEDLLVGSPSASPDSASEGAAYLFYGGPDGPNTQPDWVSEGQTNAALHGYSVASAGDVNQDGYADFLIGAPNAQVGPNFGAGRAGLYYGSATGPVHIPAREWFATAPGQNLGIGVSGVGDVDGDGYPDVVISDPGYTFGEQAEGRIRVYRGGAAGVAALPYFEWESNQVDAQVGWVCSAAGDLNGDGFADFMTGNPYWTNGETEEGSIQVFLGGPSTISVVGTLESNVAGAHLGFALSTAGDLDADGYSDIIAGARDFQEVTLTAGDATTAERSPIDRMLGRGSVVAGDASAGATFVFFGEEAGAETTWRYRFTGGLGDAMGTSVAGGGDLNGDGWPDVLYTAPFEDGVKVLNNGIISAAFSNIIRDGAAKPRRLLRTDGTTPIAIGGRSDSPNSFRLAGVGRHPMGRGKARMQWQAKAPGAALDGTGIQSSAILRTGVPTAELGSTAAYVGTATGLATGERYRLRTRYATRNPFFPHSPWFTSARNGVREADLRTFGPTGAVDVDDDVVATGLSFASPWPNPLTGASGTTLSFSLPAAARVTIDAYDAQGRRVARVHEADAPAGRSTVTWSGHGDGGRALPRGLYFLRLESGSAVETVKAVLAR